MIRFENVSKSFGSQPVLNDFSCVILQGEKVMISGPSGVGKTTFFRLILGFEKPDKGHIYYHNKLLNERRVWELRREVAYISQDLNIGVGKVSELFKETMMFKANRKHPIESSHVLELLSYFGLSENHLEKTIDQLSGGEKQRVAIVNALLLKRKVFLLDEISSSLDLELKKKVMDYFIEREDCTVIFISHDVYHHHLHNVRTIFF